MSLENVKWACIRTIVNTSLWIKRSRWLSASTQPDYIKTYAQRSDLYPCHIFTPRDSSSEQLPLVICVHGGAFILNHPAFDDPLARHLADTARCIVVSIDYRKSPQSKFPLAYEDVVELALAVIDNTTLPVDRSRVVFCGTSAGGNLSLAAAQDERLQGRLTGVIALYPVCDFGPSAEAKLATRPDPSIPDVLSGSYADMCNLYLAAGTPLEDPRISPINFASRDGLPANMLFVGCEHDMLCSEAEAMANKLATTSKTPSVEIDGGWKTGDVRWYKVKGQGHGFDHFAARTAAAEQDRIAARDATYAMLSGWLRDVFSVTG